MPHKGISFKASLVAEVRRVRRRISALCFMLRRRRTMSSFYAGSLDCRARHARNGCPLLPSCFSSSPPLPPADEWNDVSSASLASRCMSAVRPSGREGGRRRVRRRKIQGREGLRREGGGVLWPFESPRPLSSSSRARCKISLEGLAPLHVSLAPVVG